MTTITLNENLNQQISVIAQQTFASVDELEATLERELKLVQAVIEKRHSAGMLLQTGKFQLMRTQKYESYS